MYSYVQYSIDYNFSGASIGLPKDWKKRVRNYFIKSASWIDTEWEGVIKQELNELSEFSADRK